MFLSNTSVTGGINIGYSNPTLGAVIGSNPTLAGTGPQSLLSLIPTINQSGAAKIGVLRIYPYPQAVGSGGTFLIDAGTQVSANDAGTPVAKFQVDFAGNVVAAGKVTASGVIKAGQYTTATQPAYEAGAMYYNTSLGKYKIGGATAWETVTSA